MHGTPAGPFTPYVAVRKGGCFSRIWHLTSVKPDIMVLICCIQDTMEQLCGVESCNPKAWSATYEDVIPLRTMMPITVGPAHSTALNL